MTCTNSIGTTYCGCVTTVLNSGRHVSGENQHRGSYSIQFEIKENAAHGRHPTSQNPSSRKLRVKIDGPSISDPATLSLPSRSSPFRRHYVILSFQPVGTSYLAKNRIELRKRQWPKSPGRTYSSLVSPNGISHGNILSRLTVRTSIIARFYWKKKKGGLNTLTPCLVDYLIPPRPAEPLVSHLRITDKFVIDPPTTYISKSLRKVLQERKDLVEYRQANVTNEG